MATLPRYPRFLGKSTLFRIPPLWPFLKLAGVIPVFRAIDGAPGDRNVSAFATSHDLLSNGGMIALFPEGISHDEPSLQHLKTGAARIALEAGIDARIEGVRTVAVGLVYDAKARFRSRALVRVGEPIGIDRWADAYRIDGHAAVHELTDDLAQQLSAVSPAYSSWTEADVLSRIAEIVVRTPGEHVPSDVEMADQVAVASRLATVQQGSATAPLADLLVSFEIYERDLSLLGLTDSQIAAGYSSTRLRLALFWSALKVVVALPFAAMGLVVHVVPFQIVKQLAKRPTNEGIKATVKLFGCFVSFVIVYALLGFFAGRAFGAGIGLLVAIAAPLCGYAAVRLAERLKRIGGLVEGFRTVEERGDVIDSVMAHRETVATAARTLVAAS
jgi:glycerol-3-phosphate O-acyltransferase/dihydroxyacetone phosphate acyltransferase